MFPSFDLKGERDFMNDRIIGYYESRSSPHRYRRILGGLAWPAIKPGFAVLLGEEKGRDYSLNAHHYHLVTEYEDASIEGLINHLGMLEASIGEVSLTWYTDMNDRSHMEFVWRIRRQEQQRGRDALRFSSAPYTESACFFEFLWNNLKGVLDKGILHFPATSQIPGYLQQLSQEEIVKGNAQDYPAIAAIGYAVSTLSTWPTAGLPGH